MLHCNESFWASKIVLIKGTQWFEKLEREKNKIIKINYNEVYETLKEKERKESLKLLFGNG